MTTQESEEESGDAIFISDIIKSNEAESGRVYVGNVRDGIYDSIIAGRDEFNRITAVQIKTLDQAIEALNVDNSTKKRLSKQLQEYETIAKEAAEGELTRQAQEFQLRLEQQRAEHEQELAQQKAKFEQDQVTRAAELRLKQQETQTQRIIRLLDKDLVSVLIGGILLIIIVIALIVMISNGKIDARLLESAFLVLLGFFFGQGVGARGRGSSTKTSSDSDNQSAS